MEYKIENLLPFSRCLKKKAVAHLIDTFKGEPILHGLSKETYEELRKAGKVQTEFASETSVIVDGLFVPKVCFKNVRR